MRSKTIFISMIILVTAFCLSAPGFAVEKTYNIVYTMKNLTNPAWLGTWIGAQKAAAEYKMVNLTRVAPAKPDNIAEQTSLMEDVILKRPDAIVFIPVDAVALVPIVEKMNKAGIPVFVYSNEPAGGKYLFFIGNDDPALGYAAAKYGIEAIGGKGKMIIIEGTPGSSTGQGRQKGFLKAVKEYPGIEVLASQTGNFNRLKSMQVMENLLQRFPKIDLVVGANDEEAMGALEAVDQAGRLKEIKVVGIDASPDAIKAILKGRLFGSIRVDPPLAGYMVVKAAIKHLQGEKVPKRVLVPPVIVNKENASRYDVSYEKAPFPSWDEVLKQKDFVTW
jgi:ribose transport system substrate-binding protein